MSVKQKRHLESLTNQNIRLMSKLHKLEVTFSRLKNESEELLRQLLSSKNGQD